MNYSMFLEKYIKSRHVTIFCKNNLLWFKVYCSLLTAIITVQSTASVLYFKKLF